MKVVIIDDDARDRGRLSHIVQQEFDTSECLEVTGQAHFTAVLAHDDVDIVLTEYDLEWTDGARILQAARARWPYVPVLFVASTDREEVFSESLANGLSDCVLKHQLYRLPHAIRNSLNVVGTSSRTLAGATVGSPKARRTATARKQDQTALEQSEERFRILFEDSPVGISIAREGIAIYANRAYLSMFGYADVEEVQGVSLITNIAPEERPSIAERIRLRDLGETVPLRYETVGLRTDGSRFPFHVQVGRITLPEGPASVAFCTDVTERRHITEALTARARQQAAVAELGQLALEGAELQLLFDTAATLVSETLRVEYVGLMELLPNEQSVSLRAGAGWKQGLVGRYRAGAGADSLAGYTLLLGTPVIVPDLRAETRFSVSPVLVEYGITSSVSVIVKGPAQPFGVLNAFSVHPRIFSDDDIHFLRSVANVVATAVDRRSVENERIAILAREQEARTAAEAGQERLAFLAEASAVLAASLDYEEIVRSVAQLAVPRIADWVFVEMLQEDGSISRVAMAHTDPSKEAFALEYDQRYPLDPNAPVGSANVIRTGRPELTPEIPDALLQAVAVDAEQLRILRELGFRSSMVVPLQAGGRTIGDLALVVAESGRRYADDDLAFAQELAVRCALAIDNARLYREAQQAIQVRDEFLAIASHELKTPLTGLIGHIALLKRRFERDHSHNHRDLRSLERITDQAERLRKLVVDILDLSRIQLGVFAAERRPMDLSALVGEVVKEMQPTLWQHQLELHGATAPLMIDGDRQAMEQVLQNLLGNAVKYSPNGGTITLRVEQQDGQIFLEVTDPGIGIPAAAQPHLFDRFFRAENVREQQISGFGIGLFLVNQVVGLHGGTVRVMSREGDGSTFLICLPAIGANLHEASHLLG